MKCIESINIFEFTDHREYLRIVFTEAKRRRKDFRLKTVAATAGFRSGSTISMILNGRRSLSPSAAEKLARVLALAGRRKNYFLAMARYQAASTREERVQAQETMLRLKGTSEKTLLDQKQYRFLSNWFYPVLYVLAGMKNSTWNAEVLAARLGRGVTTQDVKLALCDLLNLGFVKFERDRFVRCGGGTLMTGEDVRTMAIYRYYQQMSSLAEGALDIPKEQRELSGLTVAIPRRMLPEVKERIRSFRRQMHEYLSPFEAEAEEVFQLNVQMFPLTKPRTNPIG